MTAVALYAFTCGELTGDAAGFLENVPGKIRVPVPAYLIDHPKGKVLFDTGLNIGLQQDLARYMGPLKDAFEVHFPELTDIASRLDALGISPSDIAYVVNSHLHFDHCGGNNLIPNARVVVQKREMKATENDFLRQVGAYDPINYDCGHERIELDGEFDMFGDGLVVLFPTVGHTAGHQSMRIKLQSGDVILAADCCYLKQTLDTLHLPRYADNKDNMIATLKSLRAMQAAGAKIFFGHDPEFWKTVPQGAAIT